MLKHALARMAGGTAVAALVAVLGLGGPAATASAKTPAPPGADQPPPADPTPVPPDPATPSPVDPDPGTPDPGAPDPSPPGSAEGEPPADTPPSEIPPTEHGKTPQPPKSAGTAAVPPAYDMKLRELEEKVVGLKEKVFKSKTRLLLLREQILHNVIAEARAVIIHNNDMGPSFTLDQVLYYLDNDKIYFQDNRDGVLDDKTEFEVFNGNVLPGNHMLSVEFVYRGNGTLFSYIDGYLFKIRSNYTFFATKGRITKVKVVGYERGGLTTDLEQKPYVRYEVAQYRYSRENLEKTKEGQLEVGE